MLVVGEEVELVATAVAIECFARAGIFLGVGVGVSVSVSEGVGEGMWVREGIMAESTDSQGAS